MICLNDDSLKSRFVTYKPH